MRNHPIGVFDSGIGGTSILREIVKLLPNEDIVYLADSKNAPYGERSKEAILALCKKNVDWLLAAECKLIVVACNTATTNAIKSLRKDYNIPFIGIEPAIKPAALKSQTHTIGVLATKGTLSSQLFHKTAELYSKNTTIIEVVGKGLVEYIESGDFDSINLQHLLKSFVNPLIEANIDYLVLGCSHYPYLIPLLKKIVPKRIQIIDSGAAVAIQTKQVLADKDLLNTVNMNVKVQFYTNFNKKTIEFISKKYFDDVKVCLVDTF